MNDPKEFALVIPFAGLVWMVSFIVFFLLPALKRGRKEQDDTERTLARIGDSMHKISMELSMMHHRLHDYSDRIREVEVRASANAIQGPMGPPGAPGPGADQVHELFNRVIALEQKLAMAEAEAPLDLVPEDLDARAEQAPVAFEIYRADLLRLWVGEVTIEDHVRAWSGRKVLPRPNRGVCA